MFVGERLGSFVANSRWPSIPVSLSHEAKRAAVNFCACALGSAADAVVTGALEVMAAGQSVGTASVLGREERLDPAGCAFVNAISANLLDFDDTHWPTAIHPSAPVLSAALAMAESRRCSGAQLLHAQLLGVEVACRIGCGVSPQHYDRGLHITATCGVFGAAAACAKLLELDAEQTWTALGIAASQSAGIIENLPTAAKNVAVGNAARNGMLAAQLAQRGFTAAPAALEGPFGWARALGDTLRVEAVVGGLGSRWEFSSIAYKPYPCGFVFHAIIDACHALRRRRHLEPGDIDAVIVSGNQLLLDRGNRPTLTERDARVSIAHVAAVGLLCPEVTPREFASQALLDAPLRTLRERVQARLVPQMAVGAAAVTLRWRDGSEETVCIEQPRGSPAQPLTDQELEAKFKAGAQQSIGQAAGCLRQLWGLERSLDLHELMASLSAPRPQGRSIGRQV